MMSESEELHKNHLGEEKSQYLLQHKDNPVHWFSFGPKAFELAKKEKKPILISIGYSTCHWCHVMERESFEDHQVADLLNKYFVSIKVDREELPDVDAIYMRAALSMMHGGGGWPLNVFVTPDLKPFFAGTYFPKETFTRLVAKLGETWQKAPSNLQSVADQIHQHLSSAEVFGSVSSRNLLNESLFCRFFEDSEGDFDEEYGGFGRAPKFPPSMRLQMLMRIARRSKDPATSAKAMHMVEHTLKSMVKGGLWDHLGGGFARYSTDRKWLIPHFEKMLYDNALLLYTYIEAFQMTRDSCFEAVSKELINYILTVMQHPEGGFYSAEDADSEGEEGKFYVWKKKEIDSLLLPEEAHAFCEYYGVTEKGNFEGGTNHLHLLSHPQLDWGEKKSELIAQASMKLKAVRDRRIHPLKDTKILTSWNGLMIRSMAMAAHVFADTSYAEAASKAASFIKDKLYSPSSKTLFRRYRDGEARFSGTLDDYAYLISGLLELYQTTFNTKWLQWAQELQETQDRLFGDEEKGGYFYSPAETEHPLIIRTKDFQDGAQPNSNSISALNLLMLENLTFNKKAGTNAGEASSAAIEYKEKAVRVLSSIGDILQKAPEAFTQALIALDFLTDEPLQLAIVIPKAHEEEEEVRANMVKCINEMFLPNKVVAVGSGEEHIGLLEGKAPQEGQVTAYVCQGTACLAPTTKPEKLRELLAQRGKGKTYSNL